MTTIEVMRKALEALECLMAEAEVVDASRKAVYIDPGIRKMLDENRRSEKEAITALRAELERLEAAKPVACKETVLPAIVYISNHGQSDQYAPAIPALTDGDIDEVAEDIGADIEELARWAYALAAERAGASVKE